MAIKEITDRLALSFEFDLITARLDKNLPKVEKVGAVTVYRIGFGHKILDKLFLPLTGAFKAWRLQRTRNYFCFWAMMVTFGSGAGYIVNILRKLALKKKIPVILTLQEGDSENHLQYKWGGLINLSWRLALWQADFLTGISNFLLNRAHKKGYKKESALVPNGVNVDLFAKEVSSDVKEKLIQSLQKKPEDVFLVTISRLTYKNATDDIISALTHLPENVSLIIIGKGELGPDLQEQANGLHLEDRVKFLGFVPYTDLPKYLSVCDIFVRPSRSEGFGNSFIEAMAAGVPVIATPVGGIPDFIDDGETGVFCSTDNPQSIAKAVTLLSSDKSLKEKITEQAKNRVTERYNWDYVAYLMKEVFDKQLKSVE